MRVGKSTGVSAAQVADSDRSAKLASLAEEVDSRNVVLDVLRGSKYLRWRRAELVAVKAAEASGPPIRRPADSWPRSRLRVAAELLTSGTDYRAGVHRGPLNSLACRP